MPFLGWLEYDGVEIWCDERTMRYLDAYGCGDAIAGEYGGVIDQLGLQVGAFPSDAGSNNGATFAPWVSGADYDALFGSTIGFVGLALDGAEKSPRTRAVTPAVSADGGTPGPDVAGPREISARVAVVAQDENGAAWAVNWLADVLTYGRPVPLTEYGTVPPRWGLPRRPHGIAPPLRLFADGAQEIRTLFDVVLTEAPFVEARHRLADDLIVYEVAFTLTAAVPYFYRPARQLAVNTRFSSWPNAYTGADSPITWVMTRDRPAVVRGVDVDRDQCGAGILSGCPDPVTIPDPIADLDSCAATTPMVPTYAALINTAEQYLPARQECVPVVVVDTGGAIMRRFSVRIGRRQPGGAPDPTGVGLMWEINVPFLPANGRLILDGRTGTAVVHCDGSYLSSAEESIDLPTPPQSYEPAVYGIRSGPVVWPVFQGGEDLTITAHAEDDFCSSDAVVALYIAARTDTA